MKEIWKDIPDTNGEYQISNLGNARTWVKIGSVKRKLDISVLAKTPRKIGAINYNGYVTITVYNIKKQKVIILLVHRLVAQAFIQNPMNYPVVMHKNDIKTDNNKNNLEWGTKAKNTQDASIRGLIKPAKGVARKKSNLTEADVLYIFNSKETCRELGARFKIDNSCVSDIRTGKSWNHVTGLLCTRKIRAKYSKDIKYETL